LEPDGWAAARRDRADRAGRPDPGIAGASGAATSLRDRAYDSKEKRAQLVERQVEAAIPARHSQRGSGLGRERWVIERTFAWLKNNRRLLVRTDRRADIHQSLLALACCRITSRRLETSLS
jgi:transposase